MGNVFGGGGGGVCVCVCVCVCEYVCTRARVTDISLSAVLAKKINPYHFLGVASFTIPTHLAFPKKAFYERIARGRTRNQI